MSYTPITLTTPLTATGGQYVSQLNLNFSNLNLMMAQIAAELSAVPSTAAIRNLQWITEMLGTEGILGVDSFVLSMDDDYQGLTVGTGSCVIGGLYHETAAEQHFDFEAVTAGQTKRFVVGATSSGAPSLSLVVGQYDDSEDDGCEIVFWDIDVTNTGGTYSVDNLRRRTDILANKDAFEKAIQEEFAIHMLHKDTLPVGASALEEAGVIIPWDCEVVRAYGRLTTAPGAGTSTSIDLRWGSTAVTQAASFTSGSAGQVKTLNGLATELYQLAAGSWIRPYSTPTGDPSAAADLTVVVVLRRLYHEIL